MKSFAAFALFGLLAVAAAIPFTEDQVKKGQEHVKKCIAETKVDPAIVQKLKQGDFSESDEKAECFTLCFFREAGFTDADGNQNEAVIIEKLSVDKDKTKVKAVYDKCKNEKGSSPCNKAFNLYKCYRSAVQF
jgi:hypothetical protein